MIWKNAGNIRDGGTVNHDARSDMLARNNATRSIPLRRASHRALQGLPSISPTWKSIEVSSTAEGARTVSEAAESSCAAIASTGSAKVYGIRVPAENIQQNEDNATRFHVLSKDASHTEISDRMVFTARGDASHLPGLLEAMSENDIELVSLHDRPGKLPYGRKRRQLSRTHRIFIGKCNFSNSDTSKEYPERK